MPFLGWLLQLFGGGLVGELRGAMRDWKEAQTDQERVAAKERVDTLREIIESQKVQSGVVTTGMQTGGWVFWSVWALFAVPLGIWWAAVMIDSTWSFAWSVPDLPMSVRPWADQIFNNIFYSGAGLAGATVIGKALVARR